MSILDKLRGGDFRSIGRSNAMAGLVSRQPALFGKLFKGLSSSDPLIRMRAADAVEKITRRHPEYLNRHKKTLIGKIARVSQQEVRWHAALMFSRLNLTPTEQKQVYSVLLSYLRDQSSIVRTFALQGLADLAVETTAYKSRVLPVLRKAAATGTPAMKSRARKLIAQLEKRGPH